MRYLLFLALFLLIAACDRAPARQASPSSPAPAEVRTGAARLADEGFGPLDGKRVGLITNHTARVDSVHLIDVLHGAENVTLAALFGPEHGLRGLADAGAEVPDSVDPATGVPIFSLYGATRKPSPESLQGLDVLVFDIQDIGSRFYTYISTMGLAMQAAAEAGLPFIVLDRPNPLGGTYVAGLIREPAFDSFVGAYPIPVTHGLTVGELARVIQGEAMLPGLESLDLSVVSMSGWTRDMQWPDTGLPWIETSPNIPDFETALLYPGACLIEATSLSEGRGTRDPFKLIGGPWVDAEALADTLNAQGLPGVRFEPATFTPRSIEGMSTNPKLLDQPLEGVRQVVTDRQAFLPVETGIHLLHTVYHTAPPATRSTVLNPDWLGKLTGSDLTGRMLTDGATPDEIIAAWEEDVSAFRDARNAYLLY